jgi:hypothetical protein
LDDGDRVYRRGVGIDFLDLNVLKVSF